MPMKITEDMIIADVLKKFPSSRKVFQQYLPWCPKCGGKEAETILRGATLHGIDLDAFLKELNLATRPRKKK